jgi:nucleotide-binding universal stress UspA family protein
MPFKDILFPLTSYPEATPEDSVHAGVALARALGGNATALVFKINIPNAGNALANALLDIPSMIAAEGLKSADNAKKLLDAFGKAADKLGVGHSHLLEACATSYVPLAVTEHARLRDLTLMPIGEHSAFQRYIAESVVFGSGRPIIVFPEFPSQENLALDHIGIAWDFSRPAARAVADSLPILQRAKSVKVVKVIREKTIETSRSAADLLRHLACHGVQATFEERSADGRGIGETLDSYAADNRLDLIVMGAFGHSRARDFILGGATRSVLAEPKRPVFLSH